MRKRITSTAIVAEKVYSVREEKPQFRSFNLKGRITSLDKLDRIQEREIKRMFKHLTVKSMIDEKTYLRGLRELPTTKQTITFIKEVIVPQDYLIKLLLSTKQEYPIIRIISSSQISYC